MLFYYYINDLERGYKLADGLPEGFTVMGAVEIYNYYTEEKKVVALVSRYGSLWGYTKKLGLINVDILKLWKDIHNARKRRKCVCECKCYVDG